MWNRDRFWKCNLIGNGDEFPKWKRDNYGNANGFAFMMKFQCGKETGMKMQCELHLW